MVVEDIYSHTSVLYALNECDTIIYMRSNKADHAYSITVHRSVAEIPSHEWDALLSADDLPFLEWGWYAALELSESISIASGWQGAHITVHRSGRLVGVAPLYAKMHSWGELAFDHSWQHIANQLGAEYFPKLVGMVPATPCSGYRFLIPITEDRPAITLIILRTIKALVEQWKINTVAFNFVDSTMAAQLADMGYYTWSHHGFSWQNNSFGSFADYQQQFTKNQRRNVRRERAALIAAGLHSEIIPASALPAQYFQFMHHHYLTTNEKFGPYAAHFLNEQFFSEVERRYAHRILFSCCFRSDELHLPYRQRTPIAMAMLINKNDTLYGRYWGGEDGAAAGGGGMVHFNVCYYTPIAWAIDHGYSFFDPGIGGEHKLRRGFVVDERHTLLRFTNPTLQELIARHHQQLNTSATQYTTLMNSHRPLKS